MDGSLVNVEGVRTEKEQGKEVSQGSKHRGDEGGPPCPLNGNGWWSRLFFFFFNICLFGHTGPSCGIQTLSCDMLDLVPWPGIDPRLITGAWNLSHWSTEEVPCRTHSCFTPAVFEINSAFLIWANVGFGPLISSSCSLCVSREGASFSKSCLS